MTAAPTGTDVPDATPSIAELLVARAEDDHVGLRFEDRRWRWRQVVAASAARAELLVALSCSDREEDRPLHIGVLIGNVPEYLFWLGAAALCGAVVVGINPTRRGEALAGDIRRTDCWLVVTDADGAAILDGLEIGVVSDRIIRIDRPEYEARLQPHQGADARSIVSSSRPTAGDLFLLLFTSGTTGAPKAVRCTQGRLSTIAQVSAAAYGFDRSDVAYCTMPLFHGNALMVLWGPALAVGATVALARRFTASGFVADVRRYGATTFTYVGKALAYVLATPPGADDATVTLVRGFGTEASVADQAAFERRFGCVLTEGYGSSEGGVAISRAPDTPAGSLGRPTGDVVVLDPDTLVECPPGRFDASGRLVNGDRAVGEIVNRDGPGRFEGYYANPEADAERTRNGWYWTGDLAYRDEAGFFYFAGRRGDWMRVDSENLTAGPIERVLNRFDDVATVAVYSVPDPRSGDQVMAALEMLPGRAFDPDRFGRLLADQPDLGTKWVPAFVRITGGLPQTASGKVTKGPLRAEGWWAGGDPVLLRRGAAPEYVPMEEADRRALRAEFERHGREHLIGG
ncbi:MAG: AMP-binding protein [Acidimicrobiales bacterium]|jgi:fatty-acyl-CoA synthase